MTRKIYFYSLLFGIGSIGYCLLELIWRGRTHPSMALAGGIALCLLAVIQQRLKPLIFPYRCIAGGLTITAIEFIFGLIFNIWLQKNVWDYSILPLNLNGQICLLYAVIWCFLSAPMLIFTDIVRLDIFLKTHKHRDMSNDFT